MTMTTRSSIRVKPCSPASRCLTFSITISPLGSERTLRSLSGWPSVGRSPGLGESRRRRLTRRERLPPGRRGARSPAPPVELVWIFGLGGRACSGVVGGAGAGLDRRDLAAVLEVAGDDGAADVGVGGAAVVLAVLDAVAGVAVEGDRQRVRADAGCFLDEVGVGEAGVAAVAAGRVLVEDLCCGDGGADVGLFGGGDGLAAEAEVGGHRDRDEDAQDDDDDQTLDQSEALLACQPLLDVAAHAPISFVVMLQSGARLRYRGNE